MDFIKGLIKKTNQMEVIYVKILDLNATNNCSPNTKNNYRFILYNAYLHPQMNWEKRNK